MKITKFGHCCLLIEISTTLDSGEKGVRVLTDPGSFTEAQNEAKNIDLLLITHEHQDHFHVDSVKKILENNPDIIIITNTSVDKLLKEVGVHGAQIVETGQEGEIKGLKIRGFGNEHALMHTQWPKNVQNTGYFIGERLYYPGDSFFDPKIKVDILALPVAGNWMKLSESVDFALALNPLSFFAVHDGILNEKGLNIMRKAYPLLLEKNGIKFVDLEIGRETEL